MNPNAFIIDARDRRSHPAPPGQSPGQAPAEPDDRESLRALRECYGPTLDKHQLAGILHLSARTLENKIQRGESPVPVYRAGKHYLADVRDVAAYLDARRREAHP